MSEPSGSPARSSHESWRRAQLFCRDVIRVATANGQLQELLDRVDPVPESTIVALRRLRREHVDH